MNDVVEYLNSIKTEILPSNLHGIGTFAFRNIEVGDYVFPHWKNETGLYKINLENIDNFYFKQNVLSKYFRVDKNIMSVFLIQNCHFLSPWKHFVNHSINPNIDYYGNCIIPIKKGDEVVRNYGEYDNINEIKYLI